MIASSLSGCCILVEGFGTNYSIFSHKCHCDMVSFRLGKPGKGILHYTFPDI
jgi:hypothetical protein